MAEARYADLIQQAVAARSRAYAPYSSFPVGAALLSESGQIFSGCNIEVSSYGLTICAERVAVFKAISEGVRDFRAIVVSAATEDFCPPCGACRQVLVDFAPEIDVVLVNASGQSKVTTVKQLMPDSFSPRLLDPGIRR